MNILCTTLTLTVVYWVNAHGCLNITRDFGLHGHLLRIKNPYICIEAAAVALEMWYMGAYPVVGAFLGHYGNYVQCLINDIYTILYIPY